MNLNAKGLALGFIIIAAVTASAVYGAYAAVRTTLSAEVVGVYGRTLLTARDADRRIEVVRAIAGSASACTGTVGMREPQAIEILDAAFRAENDTRVKIEIINTVWRFSAPEAADLLNRATGDSDLAVRQCAQHAKARRSQRLFPNGCE